LYLFKAFNSFPLINVIAVAGINAMREELATLREENKEIKEHLDNRKQIAAASENLDNNPKENEKGLLR
jgi:hypothetical protein